jgi:hypothetical protein
MQLMANKPDALKLRLQEAHDLFSNIEQEFPPILAKISKKNSS